LTHHYWPGFGGSAPSGFSTENEYFYFKKVDEFEFHWIRRIKFAELFSEYFSDCQSQKEKILKEELTHKDYEEIMKAYNSCN
jgi:glycyl-tRNA synthetase alpha subunit